MEHFFTGIGVAACSLVVGAVVWETVAAIYHLFQDVERSKNAARLLETRVSQLEMEIARLQQQGRNLDMKVTQLGSWNTSMEKKIEGLTLASLSSKRKRK